MNNLVFNIKQGNTDKTKQFIIIGVLAMKSIRYARNNNKYLLIKLSDFTTSVSFYIFDLQIIARFYKIQPGTILAVINPKIDDAKYQCRSFLRIINFNNVVIIGKSILFSTILNIQCIMT